MADNETAWNEKYWDMISSFYWNPSYMGWKRIQRKKWQIADGLVSVPLADIAEGAHALYSRQPMTDDEHRVFLNNKEEILNHVFDVTFAIAGDAVIQRLFCEPLRITDAGPFQSFGRKETASRYEGVPGETPSQPDGFFTTRDSAICIELKLKTYSSPEQLAKYVAIMAWEEMLREKKFGHKFQSLGLIFIVPEKSVSTHWKRTSLVDFGQRTDLAGREIRDEFLKLDRTKWNPVIKQLFDEKREDVANILDRLCLTVRSWTNLRDEIAKIEEDLDCSKVGDQTLGRLLAGLRAQIEAHEDTGVPKKAS